jgi:uncharacterized protein (TIGR01244 family)
MTEPTIDIRRIAPRLPNASSPVADVYTGGQPSESDLRHLAEAGIRTVLDLRPPEEPRGFDEAAAARAAGLEYVVLPVTYQDVPNETFDRFRELLRDDAKRPILVHCRSGNRVGALLMPFLILDERLDPQQALELALEAGLGSQLLLDIAMEYAERQSG